MGYVDGETIRKFREAGGLTQKDLADRLFVSDKTVSKWETGRGLPDHSLLTELAEVFGVSLTELVNGEKTENSNRCANMRRSRFYVCPICGNVIHAMGEGVFSCCGVQLPPLEAEPDEEELLKVEIIEDELYISAKHTMEKGHYLSFLAFLTPDRLQLVKLYPEQAAEARFKRCGTGTLYTYCTRHGLISHQVKLLRGQLV